VWRRGEGKEVLYWQRKSAQYNAVQYTSIQHSVAQHT
jgi:hypothetical protein